MSRSVALVLALTVVAATMVAATPVGAADPWHDATRSHRLTVTVDPGGTSRTDHEAVVDVDFSDAFSDSGDPGVTFDDTSIRVYEVDADGAVVGANNDVVFQFDPASGYNATSNAAGELVIHLDGTTSAIRRYQVYFRHTGSAGGFTPSDHSGVSRVTLTRNVLDAGRSTHRIVVDGSTWFFDKEGGGFTSAVAGGNDWISWSSATGSAGEFRGLPNLEFPTSLFHPGFDLVSTAVTHEGPLRVVLTSTSDDGEWKTRWSFYENRLTMAVLDTPGGEKYWFQYEGTPGGALDAGDTIIASSGSSIGPFATFANDLPATEWFAAADPSEGRSLWIAAASNDSFIDTYRDIDNVMTVMALGRNTTTQGISGLKEFAVGIASATTHGALSPIVDAAIDPITVTTSDAVSVSTTTTSTTTSSTTTSSTTTSSTTTTTTTAPQPTDGYWILTSNGRMLAFGDATAVGDGSPGGDAVAASATSSGNGYWIAHADGTVDAVGDAVFHGDASGLALNAPIVGMAVTPTGNGYWLLGADGGIFSYGDAAFHGSTGAMVLNQPVTDMAATPTGGGYYLVAADGGIFAFGDAVFRGSTGALTLDQPMTSMSLSSNGYWLVALDGGIFAFGNAPFLGSLPGILQPSELPEGRRIRAVDGGGGYLILAGDGGIFNFGSATFAGSAFSQLQPGEVAVDLIVG